MTDWVSVTSNDEPVYVGDAVNPVTAGLKEKDLIKEAFGRYVFQEVRDDVLSVNIGSSPRPSCALVEDPVNVASRLQEVNKKHGASIIVSAETRRRFSRDVPLHPLPETLFKGKTERVNLFGY